VTPSLPSGPGVGGEGVLAVRTCWRGGVAPEHTVGAGCLGGGLELDKFINYYEEHPVSLRPRL